MRPPVPDWFWLLVLVIGWPLMHQFLRDGVARLLLARRRARGKFVDYIKRG